ncbi:hypothetical protein N7540_010687 [Penicillium herquei]|nr:hypothetical protein N7540_010687 [Penicillium herquei]
MILTGSAKLKILGYVQGIVGRRYVDMTQVLPQLQLQRTMRYSKGLVPASTPIIYRPRVLEGLVYVYLQVETA